MEPIHLGLIHGAILIIYFAFVLGIGFVLKRHMRTSTDFFLSGRMIPAWVAGLAFLSANLGAQEGHRHGRLGREIRHHDEPLLLGGSDSRDGLRRRLYDAVLLR